jgi:hypothetical protein
MNKDLNELAIEAEYVSAYALAKIVNQFIEKAIPTQMTYNYVAKGLIKSKNVDGRKIVSREVAIAWIQKFVTKRNATKVVTETEEVFV